MTAIKRINKRAVYGASLLISGILGFLFATSKRYDNDILSLITEVPLGSIERVSASGGGSGDCSGSSDGSWDPALSTSGVGINLEANVTTTSGGVRFGGGGCFLEGTNVLLDDGTEKEISIVAVGDKILSSGGSEEVMSLYHIPFEGEAYAFNGSDSYFVTATHPFMTEDGWKSLDPEGTKKETPDLAVTLLSLGDVLIMNDGNVKLESMDSKTVSTTVYNLSINGSHDYYADGYLVHNVGTEEMTKLALMQVVEK